MDAVKVLEDYNLELTFDNTILLLYAKNIKGYKNLIKLATIKSDRELTLEEEIQMIEE